MIFWVIKLNQLSKLLKLPKICDIYKYKNYKYKKGRNLFEKQYFYRNQNQLLLNKFVNYNLNISKIN